MDYATLGAAGPVVSRVGLGCWAIGGHGYGVPDRADSEAAIRRALDSGITLFDTADVYGFGQSELVVSSGLGDDRHRVVVCTKGGVSWDSNGRTRIDSKPANLRRALEDSLRRLRLECVPVYYLHRHDGTTDLDDIMAELEIFRQQGKVQYLACSNADVPTLKELHRASTRGSATLVAVQNEFGLLSRRSEETLPVAAAQQMAFVSFGVLARGALSGRHVPGATYGFNDTRASDPLFTSEALSSINDFVSHARAIGNEYGRSAAQVAIRWALDHPLVTVALVGAKTSVQIDDNAGAVGWRLEPHHWAGLAQRAHNHMITRVPS